MSAERRKKDQEHERKAGTAESGSESSDESPTKGRIRDFISRHGYTLKAYWLSVFIFPPAAIFIAWKKPGWTIVHRVLGSLVPIVVMVGGPLIVAVLLAIFYGLV